MSLENNTRIAKNTLMLYIRTFFSLGISLYTSRVVLNTLGVENYGIYNVVGGLVTMSSLFSGSLTSASKRFINYEIGKKKGQNVQEVFSTVVIINLLIAIVILMVTETVGVWYLNTHLNIDSTRMNAANWVFQFSLLSFLITLIGIPYKVAIIAYEHMKAFAYIGIGEVLLKLIAVIILPFIPVDKLIGYAIFIMFIAIIVQILYWCYCKKWFSKCKFVFSLNKILFKNIASFALWNFIGISAGILMTQGVNILLNVFHGVMVNAAQGIARQVQEATTRFIINFMTAIRPQIIKSYASKNYAYMMELVNNGARYSFYLIFFISLPILIETKSILELWLKTVPDYAVVFVRLTIIYSIIQSLSYTLITGINSTGKIKKYSIIVGGFQLLNFPLSYFSLKLGFPPQSTLIILVTISFICLWIRVYLLHGMIKLSISYYLSHVLLNVLIITILSSIIPLIIYKSMNTGLFRLLSVCGMCFISTLFIIYTIGLTKNERTFIHNKVSVLRQKYCFV